MANTYITSGTSFKPYTFDEMLKPYQMYTEAYNKAEDTLDTLVDDISSIGLMAHDYKEQALYNNLMYRIDEASKGLLSGNKNSIREIQQLNREYKTKITPIKKKAERRAELVEKQLAIQSANPNVRFTKDYSKEGLDGISDSSTFGIIDLDSIYKQAATEFGDITSKMYRDNVEITPVGDTGYYNVMQGYGYTPLEFNISINDQTGAPYDFYKAKADAIDARTDLSKEIKTEMKQAVLRGMSSKSGTFSSYHINSNTGKPKTPSGGDKSNSITDIKVDANNVGVGVFRGKPVTFKVTGKDENGNWIIDYNTIRTITGSSQANIDAQNQGTIKETETTDPYGRTTRTTTITRPNVNTHPAETTIVASAPIVPLAAPEERAFGKK